MKYKYQRKLNALPPSIQLGLINQTGQGNIQTVHLKLVQQLRLCHSSCDSLKRELALSQALVAAKDETIALLRSAYQYTS